MVKNGKPVFSYSQINTFQTCPYSWHMIYEERVQNEDNAFSQYGTLIHDILEKFAKGELKRNELAAEFDWRFDGEVTEEFPPNKYVELCASYRKQGIDFFNGFEGFNGMTIRGVEEHFFLERDFYWLQGYIDLIYEDANGALVCRDWKSAKHWSPKETAEHARQVYLYSAHCKEKYGRYPDRLEFFHFREGNRKTVIHFDEKAYQEALQWADAGARAILDAWDFEHKEDEFFCSNLCSCRSSCEYRT